MPTTYTEADKSTYAVLRRAVERFHRDVMAADPTFTVLMASNGEDAALKRNGYKVQALIKVVGLKDRAAGMNDVLLLIDSAAWGMMSEEGKLSLMDHELTHLILKRDENGNIKRDDLDRPKFGIRPHDFEIGGFAEVIERHKEYAHEAWQVDQVWGKHVQGLFKGWG